MKKKEFIKILKEKLCFLETDEISEIISCYEENIKKRIKNKEKEEDVIASYGDIDKIIKKMKKKKFYKKISLNIEKIKENIKKFFLSIAKWFKKKYKSIRKQNKKVRVSKETKQEKSMTRKSEEKSKKKLITSVISYILIVLLFVFITLLFTFLIGFFDGIKILGPGIFSLGIVVILSIIIMNIENYFGYRLLNRNIKFIINMIPIVIISMGISIIGYEIYKLDYVNDIDEKYVFYKSENKINVDDDIKEFNIYFNSFYKNNYSVIVDENMENTIQVQVKYYEAVNDLHYKNAKDSLYISLTENFRDLISFYISNLKNNKMYSYKELSRYEILIYMSPKIKEKVKIHH